MKIVMILPATPRIFGDTAARWYYVLLRNLLENGHTVDCLVVTEESTEVRQEAMDRLLAFGGTGKLSMQFFSPVSRSHPLVRKMRNVIRPFSELYYAEGLRDALDRALASGYDILHCEQLWTGWLAQGVERSLLNIHHFEVIDLEGQPLAGLRERKALLQMTRATKAILRGTQRMRVFTPRLLERAKEINSRADYWTVPFALDLTNYPVQAVPEEPVLGLIGSMHWKPSRSAGERLITKIWPLVKRRVPNARLFVAGWNARKYLGKYLPQPDVTLEDSVSHPLEFFSKAAVMLYAPSRGSGMKIKVLESMAYGVPVVTTWEGVEGLQHDNGVHCWVEDTDEALAERAAQLLEDASERKRMQAAARQRVEDLYSPTPVMKQMMDVYGRIMEAA